MSLLFKCVEDICECSICNSVFETPKVLPCLHTFCLACLKNYCLQTNNNHFQPKITEYNCPNCRALFKLSNNNCEDLPTNFLVNKLCHAKKAMESTKDVVMLNLETVSTLNYQFCKAHLKSFELYCLNCKKAACVSCIVKEHKEHSFVEMETILINIQSKINLLREKINILEANKLLKIEEQKNNLNTNMQSIKKSLKDKCQLLKDELDKQVENILKDCYAEFECKLKCIEDEESQTNLEQISLKELEEEMQAKLNAKDIDVEINELLRMKNMAEDYLMCEVKVFSNDYSVDLFKYIESDYKISNITNLFGSIEINYKDSKINSFGQANTGFIIQNKNNMTATTVDTFGTQSNSNLLNLTDKYDIPSLSSNRQYNSKVKKINQLKIIRQKIVAGITMIGYYIFIVHKNSNIICIYNATTRQSVGQPRIKTCLKPIDLISIDNYLFIYDKKISGLYRVTVNQKLITSCDTLENIFLNTNSIKLACSNNNKVLIYNNDENKVFEYSTDMELIKITSLGLEVKKCFLALFSTINVNHEYYILKDLMMFQCNTNGYKKCIFKVFNNDDKKKFLKDRYGNIFFHLGNSIFWINKDLSEDCILLHTSSIKIEGIYLNDPSNILIAFANDLLEIIELH